MDLDLSLTAFVLKQELHLFDIGGQTRSYEIEFV